MTDFIVILLGFESIDVKIHFRNYELCVRFMVSSIWCRKLNRPRWSTRARAQLNSKHWCRNEKSIEVFFSCKPIITPTDFVIVHRFRQAWLRVSLGFVTFVSSVLSLRFRMFFFFFFFVIRRRDNDEHLVHAICGSSGRRCASVYHFIHLIWSLESKLNRLLSHNYRIVWSGGGGMVNVHRVTVNSIRRVHH